MRRILIDYARARGSAKRGVGLKRVDLEEALGLSGKWLPQVLELNAALQQLAKFDERKAQVVEMRYFGGLTSITR